MHDYSVRPSGHSASNTHQHMGASAASGGFERSRRRRGVHMLQSSAAWLSTAALLLWWWFATSTPAQSRPLPSPREVWSAGVELFEDGMLLPSIGISLARVLGGLALGLLLAVPAGLLSGATRVGLTLIDKPVHMLRAIPFPALSPLFIVWLGIDETMKIALIAVGVFGLVYVNLRDGVRGVDPKLLELARTLKLGRGTVLWRILFRGALPSFMTGLRFALTVAWIALVTCETVNSSMGLGYILARSQQFSRTDQMVLCVVLYALLGLASEALVGVLERAATRYRTDR